MYFSPFIKMWLVIDGQDFDISEAVAKLTYKRDVEKENELQFTVEQSYIERLSDSMIKRGMTIKFQYGFKGGDKSEVHQARIVEVAHTYTKKISMSVTARDTSTVIKKTFSDKIWNDVTTTEICKEIASRYNLEFKGETTDFIWKNYPQSQKDDWAFLMEIVQKEQSGNYMIYVDDGFLILERRGLDKNSSLSFQYGDGSQIISFSVSEQEKKSGGAMGMAGTTFTGFDPDKIKDINAMAEDGNLDENIDSAPFSYKYSANGELLNQDELAPGEAILAFASMFTNGFGRKKVTNIKDQNELRSAANFGTKEGKLKVIVGTLKINGVPGLKLNSMVTMRGLLPIHEGNYLVKAITDEVSTSGFVTTLDMERNAALRPNKKTELPSVDLSKVNTTVGAQVLETKKEIFIFDANGERIDNPKTEYKIKK